MADSAVVITAGTGTNIDTRTEATNGHHRQVVVLGDPATNAGVAPVDATAGLKVDLGSDNDVTVTGTVTANLSATDNAVLDAIEADTTTLAGAVAGTEMQVDIVAAIPAGTNNIGDVDVLSVVPGTGATNLGKAIDTATGATDTGVLALATRDDALSALTPIEGDNVQLRTDSTGALWVKPSGTVTVDGSGVTQPVSHAALTELAGAINASAQMDVNIAASGATVPVSNAALTELAAAINSDKVDVNIVSGSAAGTEYTEDAAAAANPVGGVVMLVREDGRAGSLTTTDGDNVALRGNNKGEAYVKDTDASALLTTIDADTSNLSTKIDTIAGAVSGTEMQVDVLTMPTVTVTASNLDVQSGGADLATTTQAGAIQTAVELIDDTVKVLGTDTYTEATSKGVVMGAVRRDADTTLANTTNEFTPLQVDANGYLKVEVFDGGGSHTVDNNGTFATQVDGAALTALQLIDDPVATDDTTTHSTGTTKVMGIGAVATPTDASVNANDIGMPAMTTDRKLHVAVMDALPAGTAAIGKLAANSGVDIGDTDVTSVVPGTGATNLGKAEDAGHTTGDTGVMSLGVRVDTPNTALTNTDADYSPIATNKLGSVRTAALEDDLATAATAHTYKYYTNAGAVTDGIIWSPAAGKRWFLTSLTINVSAAATVTIEDDVAAGDVVRFKFELAANSGVSIPFPGVPMFSGEDAADLLVTTTAGNVYITAVGYEI